MWRVCQKARGNSRTNTGHKDPGGIPGRRFSLSRLSPLEATGLRAG